MMTPDPTNNPEPATPPPADAPHPVKPVAWQPFTFDGVVAFAGASLARLWIVQIVIALMIGLGLAWFAGHAWAPVVRETLQQLPETVLFHDGALEGLPQSATAANRFLSLVFDTQNETSPFQGADIQVELHQRRGQIGSAFQSWLGVLIFKYPAQTGDFPLGGSCALAWWDARGPMLRAAGIALVVLSLLMTWTLLSTLYSIPARLVAFFASRNLALGQCWRLCGAALMPGAVLMLLGVVLYGCQWIDLIGLSIIGVFHIILGWIYVLAVPLRASKKAEETQAANPFSPTDSGQ